MTEREHAIFERDAWWIGYHARDIKSRLRLLTSRPEWETRFQAELQQAKDDLTDALEMIAECQRDFDALPTVRLLEAAE
jgi:hypothetical protein